MVPANLPDEVVQFVAKHIRSLDQLEVLLLVSALPDREWSVAAVDSVIRSNPEAVFGWLDGFVRLGILSHSEETKVYHYQPTTDELSRAIATLGATYKMSRHRVIELIYAEQPSAIKSFSDAFRIRKES
jgi:hypothetical protein